MTSLDKMSFTQWIVEYLPKECGTLLGTISKFSLAFGVLDKVLFDGKKAL